MIEKELMIQETSSSCDDSCRLPTAQGGECGCAMNAAEPARVNVVAGQGDAQPNDGFWGKVRGGLMFGVACITSPCCTPLIVPIGLGLLAGTPVAAWLGANLGWVYGGLTLISVLSLILGLRWYFAHQSIHFNAASARSVKTEASHTHLE
jgi:hypothetical protein